MKTKYILAQVYDYKGGELSTDICTADEIVDEVLEMLPQESYDGAVEIAEKTKSVSEVTTFLESNGIEELTYASGDTEGYTGTIYKITTETVTEIGLNGVMKLVARTIIKENNGTN